MSFCGHRALYVLATKQHTGKTTVSLAFTAAMQARFGKHRVGYIKPIGQRHVKIDGHLVDADARLFKDFFQLDEISWPDLSPVIFTKEFTRQILDEIGSAPDVVEKKTNALLERIEASFERQMEKHDFVVVEGSGHVGVGSLAGLPNSLIAAKMKIPVLLVVNGGIGSTFDELATNKAMCDLHGVPVAGVVVNKVNPKKLDMIRHYLGTALHAKWGVPLVGCVPDLQNLSKPTMRDFEALFKQTMCAGEKHRAREFDDIEVITCGTDRFLEHLRHGTYDKSLLFFYKDRSALILALLEHARHGNFSGGLILTGDTTTSGVDVSVLRFLQECNVPMLMSNLSTLTTVDMLRSFMYKLHAGHPLRVQQAIDHYTKYINFNALCGFDMKH